MGTSTLSAAEAALGHPAPRRTCEAGELICSIGPPPSLSRHTGAPATQPHEDDEEAWAGSGARPPEGSARRLRRPRVLCLLRAPPACAASLTISWCRPHNPH
jgi:hypothetical protein